VELESAPTRPLKIRKIDQAPARVPAVDSMVETEEMG